MDYEKYYKTDTDNTFTVHFKNKGGLDIGQIKKIFSAYGTVLSVNIAGDEYGLRFIKYKTLDETINCLKDMQNNNEIDILPEKNKINGQNKRIDKNSSQRQAIDITNKQFNGNFIHDKKFLENRVQQERLTYNAKTSNRNNRSDNADNFTNTCFRNIQHGYKSNTNVVNCNKPDLASNEEYSSIILRQNSNDSSSNITMDYEKYYKMNKDGSYTVHFANRQNFTLDEIKKLFSFYGNVLAVHVGGDSDNGLRFVKYKTLEEIINCLKGFENNNAINILPQKHKTNRTIKKTDQNYSNRQIPNLEDSSEKTFIIEKQFNSTSTCNRTSSETGEKQYHNTTTNWDNRCNNSDNFSDINSQNFGHSSNPNKNVIKLDKSDSLVSNGKLSSPSRQQNFINTKIPDNEKDHGKSQQKTKFSSSTKTDGNNYVNKNMSYDSEIPMLNSNAEVMQKEFDTMSNCLLLAQSSTSSNIRVIPMQEIIVANIHENYGMHYILHLFEKHDPVSATAIKVTPESNIRYCRVYFKTVQDTIAVEEEFDNFVLSEKNLIVLRESKLTEEAA